MYCVHTIIYVVIATKNSSLIRGFRNMKKDHSLEISIQKKERIRLNNIDM